MSVIIAVPYLSTALAGCSLDQRTNNGARKLSKHPSYKKKKKFSICTTTHVAIKVVKFDTT
jgi:hypothetical protein